jgi:hypothetical protein
MLGLEDYSAPPAGANGGNQPLVSQGQLRGLVNRAIPGILGNWLLLSSGFDEMIFSPNDTDLVRSVKNVAFFEGVLMLSDVIKQNLQIQF